MSRPLERDDDESHYVPSQRLASFRDAHFDGVRYPSALHPNGRNLVIFDPAIVAIGESKLVRITETNLNYEVADTRGSHPLT